MRPEDIRPVGETEVLIHWDDGHRSLYTWHHLRFNCPCATCRDEWTGRRVITEDRIAPDIRAQDIAEVGRYAFRFMWSDQHHTGIYGFDYLRNLCSCEDCRKKTP